MRKTIDQPARAKPTSMRAIAGHTLQPSRLSVGAMFA
jgi:hypothetical protein